MNKARINRIILKNIKSYKEGDFCFQDGVTVISGENGAGKSTVFEAVGFCLFGVPPRDFIGSADKFIRQGASSGEVEVEYRGIDGGEYRVRRQKQGSASVYKYSENGWFPLDGEDVNAFVRKTLGLKSVIGLGKQFVDIIGPFQSEFVTPFFLSDTKRQDRFDEILGIDRWRNLDKKTSSWKTNLQNRIGGLGSTINALKPQISDVSVLLEEMKEAAKRQAELNKKIESAVKEAENSRDSIGNLESLLKSINNLDAKIKAVQQEHEGKKNLLKEKNRLINEAGESRKVIESTQDAWKIYVSALKEREDVENQRVGRDEILKKINSIEKLVAGERGRIETESGNNRQALESYADTIKKLQEDYNLKSAESKKAKEEYEAVDLVLGKLKEGLESFLYIDISVISRKKTEAGAILERIIEKEKEVKHRIIALEAAPELEKSVEKLKSIDSIIEKTKISMAEIEQKIKYKKSGLKALDQGQCPFFGESCLNLRDKDPSAFFGREIKALEIESKQFRLNLDDLLTERESLKQNESKLIALESTRKSLKEDEAKIADLIEDVKTVFTIEDISEISESIGFQARKFNDDGINSILIDFEKSVSEISPPEDFHDYPEFLGEVDKIFSSARDTIAPVIKSSVRAAEEGAKEKYGRLSKFDAEVKNIEKSLAEAKKEYEKASEKEKSIESSRKILNKRIDEKESLEKHLSGFEGIDEKLAEINRTLSLNEESYNLYISHRKTAEGIPELACQIRTMQSYLTEITKNISDMQMNLKNMEEKFSPEILENERKREKEILAVIEGGRKDLEWISGDMKRRGEELRKKQDVEKQIKSLENERKELEKTLEFAGFLRQNVFRQIGAKVSSVLREQISETANEVYRAISGKNEELFWGDNYAVELVDIVDNKRRIRNDRQLSGGQFMSAVIALRLALLQAVGSPFAFFDEPTSNLDEDRRKNLAEAFRCLDVDGKRWYRQLFLVSHDESFQGISGNVIELEMDETGATRILSLIR